MTRGADIRLTLDEAREVRADATLHDDETLTEACRTILSESADEKEREKASALLTLVEE